MLRSAFDYKDYKFNLNAIPTHPHWVVMMVESCSYTVAGYDRYDHPETRVTESRVLRLRQ